jgi:predicted ABC-type ATPase
VASKRIGTVRPADLDGPRIYVLAGVNGAGKSSVLGAAIRAAGGRYYNPDEAARRILEHAPALGVRAANAEAWEVGRRHLVRAIEEGLTYAFETTLGGRTITALLLAALRSGREVLMRYVGLDGVERHIARVRTRVAAGGHDIAESTIRQRYVGSRANLLSLLPHLTFLEIYDNTSEASPGAGFAPEPILLLGMERGRITSMVSLDSIPEWAKPIVMVAMSIQPGGPGPPSGGPRQ